MESSYGIVLGRDVVNSRCKSVLKNRNARNLNDELFHYLEMNPNLGIITSITDSYIKGKLWGPMQKRKEGYKQMLCEYECIKENLKLEKVNYRDFELSLGKVNTFFDNLVGQNQAFQFHNKYEMLVRPVRREKKPKFSIGDSYRKALAEVVSLKPRYDKLMFVSQNPKFSHPFVLNALEERFDVVGGDASLILREMEKLASKEYICGIESIS